MDRMFLHIISNMDPKDLFSFGVLCIFGFVIYLLIKEIRDGRKQYKSLNQESNVALGALKDAVRYVGDQSVTSAKINERSAQTMATALTSALIGHPPTILTKAPLKTKSSKK